ncbi:glutamate ABC transporter substrate-binding protein [Rhodococcoides corynebacterioides]|uniref:glutamate ABC transporter substrate-binding protein n=1 Tax=Rhodococcoides corynebacterioides TaxID=53972 RepID=UPI001C9AD656|nr:glutamate ABC transporter substrate-binding protein [Rhodococcus corynebacterioides]MBY6362669.1 glutamate ABC transporter substrate-binding protein [Rhodococcus corynebacterioides]
MRRARATSVAAMAALAVLLTGCADNTPVPAAPATATVAQPLPDGATTNPTPTTTAPPPDCGDPRASLQPDYATPDGAGRPSPNVDAIRTRGRLIVGLDTGSNLFSFRDPVTGEMAGFDVDIAREVARDLLGDPDRIEYRILSSAQRLDALAANEVDIVVKTMTITCARRERVDFSSEYFRADQRVLTVAGSGIDGIDDLAGRRVCAAAGTTSLQRIQRLQPTAQVVSVPSWADCLVVLQQGAVEAVSTDDAILAGLAAQDPYLQIVGGSIAAEPYGIGVTKGHDDVVRFVNRVLERLRNDGTWNALYARWLSVLGPSPGAPFPVYGGIS